MSDCSLPICIVGSGLSGISAAKALVSRGCKVLMIDPGLDLPPQIADIVSRIAEKPAWQWDGKDREYLQKDVESTAKGVKEKRLFGSDFASQDLACFPVEKQNTKYYMSFAKSGIGNIWGCGLLPMHAGDMSEWPISLAELQPHYRSVLEFMPLSGRQDRLEKLFPLDVRPSYHAPSRQASCMFARMEKNAAKLERQGLFFGASRLAGRFHNRDQGYDCQYCGMCMYGCPYGNLYTGRETFEELAQTPNFSYQPGMVVTHLNQSGETIQIHATDPDGSKLEPIKVSRVILACGPFATAKIILSTLNFFDTEIKIKTSDQYYLPFLSLSGQATIQNEKLHTMCQAFWVLKNPKISPYLIHSSIYTYNDLYAKAMRGILRGFHSLLNPLFNVPLSRLHFSITYLHSNHSSVINTKLRPDDKQTLIVEGEPNPQSRKIFGAASKHWMRLSRYTGLIPLPFYKGERPPGAGNHFGGSFPMSNNPTGLQTDTLGRLPGLDRVHIVDSSVFPSIPATTITFSIMANAHRIASQIPKVK